MNIRLNDKLFCEGMAKAEKALARFSEAWNATRVISGEVRPLPMKRGTK